MTITVYDSEAEVSQGMFTIKVESPKDAINTTIIEYEQRIKNLETQINAFPEEYRALIDLDINELKETLGSIKEKYIKLTKSDDSTDDEFIEVMTELTAISVPIEIKPSKSITIKVIDDIDEIDLDEIDELFGESCDSESVCKNAIAKWFINNIEMKITQKVYSQYEEDSNEALFSTYEIEINPEKTLNYEGFLVIELVEEDVIFDKDYETDFSEISTGVTLDLSSTNKVSFATQGDYDIFDIPIYLVPEISELSLGSRAADNEGKNKWLLPSIILAIILFIALIIYFLMRKWYEKNYENSLFKNKSDLDNLIAFIKNAQGRGLSNTEIKKRLKQSRWNGEQINYAIKKISGFFGAKKNKLTDNRRVIIR